MAAYRETAAGEIEVYPHRVKTFLVSGSLVLFALIGAIIVLADPSEWAGWASLAFFGGLGALVIRRWAKRGLLSGRPALVLGPEGLSDRQSDVRVSWDEIEEIEYRELHVRASTQRFLGLWVRDPEAVRARVGGVASALGRLDDLVGSLPPVNISISMLGTTTAELLGLVRRYYAGPIRGFDGEIDPTPERPARARRLRSWAVEWAIGIAIAVPVVVLIVWLS